MCHLAGDGHAAEWQLNTAQGLQKQHALATAAQHFPTQHAALKTVSAAHCWAPFSLLTDPHAALALRYQTADL